MSKDTCEIAECERASNSTVPVTDRDGGTGRLKVCKICERAWEIGRRDHEWQQALEIEEVVYDFKDLRTTSSTILLERLEDEFDEIPEEFYPPRSTSFEKLEGVSVERKIFREVKK